jgi:plastocyanin domain-containing protein
MQSKSLLLGLLLGIELTVGIAAGRGWAQPNHAKGSAHAPVTRGFQRIEQPFSLKMGVTTLGVILIALELWWFLWKNHGRRSKLR